MAKKTRKQLSEIAHRAVATRRARDAFFEANNYAYWIAEAMAEGHTSRDIAEELEMPVATVRAYMANITRGAYGDALVACNF